MQKISFLVLALMALFVLPSCTVTLNDDDKDTGRELSDSSVMEKIENLIPTIENPEIMKKIFGTMGGKEVFLYTMTNTNGITVKITNYGGIITSILVPDQNGKTGDIVLGFDSLEGYLNNSPYFGVIVGRYSNRIAKGKFSLNGKTYQLAINNGNNSLHGGLKGFDKVIWDAMEIEDSTGAHLRLTYLSKDGEEGYPGNMKVVVVYTLNDRNELTMVIEAETDKPTPVNICNHSYFNLSEADTSILGHILTLYADQFTEVNSELIPTGRLPFVRKTPMDFNNSIAIGERIAQVKGGYDHNYVIAKKSGELAMAAKVFDSRTGRQVEIITTQPGVQFYSGNFLDGTITGKGNKVYKKHYGLCLETQHFPDSPNQPDFPNTILKPGEKYLHKTVYKFSVLK